MAKYDNYNNKKRITAAGKELKRHLRNNPSDLEQTERLKKAFEAESLFTSCQIFGTEGFFKDWESPNGDIMFSDDNRVMMFYNELVRYEDIKHCCIIGTTPADSKENGRNKMLFLNDLWSATLAQYGTGPVWSSVATPSRKDGKGFFLQIDLASGNQMVCRIPNSTLASNTIPFQWRYLEEKLQKIVAGNLENSKNV